LVASIVKSMAGANASKGVEALTWANVTVLSTAPEAWPLNSWKEPLLKDEKRTRPGSEGRAAGKKFPVRTSVWRRISPLSRPSE
jgi:hypothetical protein